MTKIELELFKMMSEKDKEEYLLHKIVKEIKKEKERRNKNGL